MLPPLKNHENTNAVILNIYFTMFCAVLSQECNTDLDDGEVCL
jgi:hypothetical protein